MNSVGGRVIIVRIAGRNKAIWGILGFLLGTQLSTTAAQFGMWRLGPPLPWSRLMSLLQIIVSVSAGCERQKICPGSLARYERAAMRL